jgi:hypothetical protein
VASSGAFSLPRRPLVGIAPGVPMPNNPKVSAMADCPLTRNPAAGVLLIDASTAARCSPVYQGSVRTSIAGATEARTTPRRDRAPRGWVEDAFLDLLAEVPGSRLAGGEGDVDVADVGEVCPCEAEAFFGHTAAADPDVRS